MEFVISENADFFKRKNSFLELIWNRKLKNLNLWRPSIWALLLHHNLMIKLLQHKAVRLRRSQLLEVDYLIAVSLTKQDYLQCISTQLRKYEGLGRDCRLRIKVESRGFNYRIFNFQNWTLCLVTFREMGHFI